VAFAEAYVRFAIKRPGLLAVMHTSLHQADAADLREANDRAFAPPIALIAEARARGDIVDDPDRVDMAVLATLQGLAALVTTGISGARRTEALVSNTIQTLVDGLAPR
jgi:sulfur transfer protein SufE